jgi:DNA-binding transcriptional MerR regulator
MNAFTIKDLENLSGIKAHTIRIWEQRYSFLKPKRSDTNIRYYDSDELKRLLNIALLNKYGYKISHIDRMGVEVIREKILGLPSEEAKQERMVNFLLHGMIDLETAAFEQILDEHIRDYGVDKTITSLIFPFLQKLGILWLTDHIRVSHEHLVSNVVRQKLIMGIENTPWRMLKDKIVVLFLPPGEYHEIGLLYVYYQLKVKGLRTIYLGADVPVEELEYVCRVKKPDFLFSHLTSLPARFNLEKFFDNIHSRMNGTSLVISGKVLNSYGKKLPKNVHFKRSIEEVVRHLSE